MKTKQNLINEVQMDFKNTKYDVNDLITLLDQIQENYGSEVYNELKSIELIKIMDDFEFKPSDLMTEDKAKALDILERNLKHEEFVAVLNNHYVIFKITSNEL